MRRLRQWLIRLTTSLTRRQDDTRLREELDDHVAFETEANLRRGLPPAEARRRALLTFGSIETFKENYRDQQGVPPLEHLLQDESLLLVFCASDGVPPEDIAPARRVLAEIAGEIDDDDTEVSA